MKKERLRILDLLEQGKITADEASKLLEALKAQPYEFESDDCDISGDIEDKLNNFSKAMDSFAKDFCGKVGDAFKDVEPRVRNVTKNIIGKTADIMDEISKSLNESIKNMDNKDCCCNSCENPEGFGNEEHDAHDECQAQETTGEQPECNCDNEPREN